MSEQNTENEENSVSTETIEIRLEKNVYERLKTISKLSGTNVDQTIAVLFYSAIINNTQLQEALQKDAQSNQTQL